MLIRRLTSLAGPDFDLKPGDVLDVPGPAAQAWIGLGDAEAAEGDTPTVDWPYWPAEPETAEAPAAPEAAVKPAPKRRRS